jgi:hypothetical protein
LQPNYLLVLVVVVELDLVVETLPLALVVVVVLDVVVVLPVLAGLIVAIGVAVFAGVTFAGLLTLPVLPALFDVPPSGQAAPSKPNVKTAERAITFFISIKFSCLLQRMYIYLFV